MMAQVPLEQFPEAMDAAYAAGDPSRGQEDAHVGLIGRMLGLVSQGRFGELRGFMTDDVTYEIAVPATLPWVRRAAGVDNVINALAANFAHVHEQRTEPLALVSQGDTVMMMARETGRMTDTGVPYQALLAQQYTFRDGRLAVFRSVNQVE
jgi:ketosteroid isomerase-like protein